MKKIYPLLLLLFFGFQSLAQLLTPDRSGHFCPNTNTSFTFQVNGHAQNLSYGTSVNMSNMTSLATNYTKDSDGSIVSTMFVFTAIFSDVSQSHSFSLRYELYNSATKAFEIKTTTSYEYKWVKSLFGLNGPAISMTSFDAPRCQMTSRVISFPNMKYKNTSYSSNNEFGELTQYQYNVPAGWKVNGETSAGTGDWKTSGNSVTIESNMATGGKILVRGINSCNATYTPSHPTEIPISRPAPTLEIDGLNEICTSPETYTINGLPAGAQVKWELSDYTLASIPNPGVYSTSPTISVTKLRDVAEVDLIATVMDCMETYPSKTFRIILGRPSEVDRFWVDGDRFDYNVNGPNQNYTVCPGESLDIRPNITYNPDKVSHQWEVVSGSYNMFSANINAYVNTSSFVGATLEIRYRAFNRCGANNWEHVYFTNMNCDNGEEPYRTGKIKNTAENNVPSEALKLSPNPAVDYITYNHFGAEGATTIVSSTGTIVKRFISKENTNKVYIGDLKPGVYVLQISTKGGVIKNKFVKI